VAGNFYMMNSIVILMKYSLRFNNRVTIFKKTFKKYTQCYTTHFSVTTATTATASVKLANDMVYAISSSGVVNIMHFKNPGSLTLFTSYTLLLKPFFVL
jgi:hypothetical protein